MEPPQNRLDSNKRKSHIHTHTQFYVVLPATMLIGGTETEWNRLKVASQKSILWTDTAAAAAAAVEN